MRHRRHRTDRLAASRRWRSRLAERRGGTVINADAMQTYDAFPILTAQPTAEERARVPHGSTACCRLSETLSAARWRDLASAEIERCRRGPMPILCGGSGLYLRTLMQGISAIPAIAAEVRDQANADWEAMGADAFRARLAERDPAIVGAAEARRPPAPRPGLGGGAGDRPAAQRLAEAARASRRPGGSRPSCWRPIAPGCGSASRRGSTSCWSRACWPRCARCSIASPIRAGPA